MNPYIMSKIAAEIYLIIMLCIIFAQWKKSDKELKVFGMSALFIVLGNLTEILSCFSTGRTSDVFVMLSIVFINVSLPLMAVFYARTVNADAQKTVMQKGLPNTILFLSSVNTVLTIISFIVILIQPNEGVFSVECVRNLLYSLEGLTGLIMCVIVTTKRKYMQPWTLFILIFPILLSIASLITTLIFPQIHIGYICISIGIFFQYITLLRRIGSEAELKEHITMEILRTDALTHLMNRQAFSDFLDTHTGTTDAGVIFSDVNGLKKTNDEFGHSEGDKLIVKCAELLKSTLPNADLYRISGDEFVAIYYGLEKTDHFEEETDKLKSVLKENGSLLSTGAFYGKHTMIVDTIRQAEKLMYDGKRAFYESSGMERRHS